MIEELDLRTIVYGLLAAANIVIFAAVFLRHRTISHLALLITACAVSAVVINLITPVIQTPRGFVLSLALGAFLASGVVMLSEDE